MSLLSLKEIIVKIEKNTILDIPHLEINKDEILTIIGPNGAGKSTLLMCIANLLKPQRGEIFFHGQKVGEAIKDIDFRKKVTAVFQQPLLFDATVFNNVAYGLKIRNINREEIKRRVMTYLQYFGIEGFASRSAKHLSGGEAQRVSIARAFAVEPELLLLDEPFSALDAPTSETLISELKATIKKTNTTAILVTHNRMEALQLATNIAVMERGKIVQVARPEDIFQKPVNEFVATFSGIESILRGVVTNAVDGLLMIEVGSKQIEAVGDFAIGQKVIAFIRPETIVISLTGHDSDSSAKNNLKATLLDGIALGHFHKLHLDCGFSLNAFVTNQTFKELNLGNNGQEVFISFKATGIHVIPA